MEAKRVGCYVNSFVRAQNLLRPTAFLHIPKCAGMSMVSALSNAGFEHPALHLFDETLFGSFKAFDTIDSSIRLTNRPDFQWQTAWDVVSGHVSLPTIRANIKNARVFTVLREPAARLLSLWSYHRSIPDEQLDKWGLWADEIRKAYDPLAVFLGRPDAASRIDNVITRFMLGRDDRIPIDSFIFQKDFDDLERRAKVALSRLDFVGLIEDQKLQPKLETFLGRTLTIPRENVTPKPPPGREWNFEAECTSECLDLLKQRTEIDRRLWQSIRDSQNIQSNTR